MERLVGTLHTPAEDIDFNLTADSRFGPLTEIEITPERYDTLFRNSWRQLHHPKEMGGVYNFTKDIITASIQLQQRANEPGNSIEYKEQPTPWEVEDGQVY